MQFEMFTSFTFSNSFFSVKDDVEYLLIDSIEFDDEVNIPYRASSQLVEIFVSLHFQKLEIIYLFY
jgi:hypothetical protein